MDSESVIRALGALAHERRLEVFRQLVQAGPEGVAAGVLADRMGVPPSSLSFHLTQLDYAGLVSQRREGRSILYAANYAAMDRVLGYLTDNCCAGARIVMGDCCPLPETARKVPA